VRDAALQKLRQEYEVAKAKVRKYREIVKGQPGGGAGDSTGVSNAESHLNNSGVGAEIRQMKENVERLILERDRALAEKAQIAEEAEEARLALAQATQETPHMNLPATARTLDITVGTEVEMRPATRRDFKDQLLSARRGARREGASAALAAAADAYSSAAKDYQNEAKSVVESLARRMNDLLDFLTHLFALEGSGAMDFSAMSGSMRDALRRSMEDARRLSQSLSRSSFLHDIAEEEDVNETQVEGGAILALPCFVLPEIRVEDVSDVEPHVDLGAELEAALAEAKVLKVTNGINEFN